MSHFSFSYEEVICIRFLKCALSKSHSCLVCKQIKTSLKISIEVILPVIERTTKTTKKTIVRLFIYLDVYWLYNLIFLFLWHRPPFPLLFIEDQINMPIKWYVFSILFFIFYFYMTMFFYEDKLVRRLFLDFKSWFFFIWLYIFYEAKFVRLFLDFKYLDLPSKQFVILYDSIFFNLWGWVCLTLFRLYVFWFTFYIVCDNIWLCVLRGWVCLTIFKI